MYKVYSQLGLLVSFILVGVLLSGTTVPAMAAGMSQEDAAGDAPPSIESFNHLFEGKSLETADAGDQWAGESTGAGEGSPPTARESIVVEPSYYYPSPSGLSVRVNRGCGSVYNEGEYLTIHTYIPQAGYLTVWASTDGMPWHRLRGPVYVQPGTIPILTGSIAEPTGNELVYARLRTMNGQILDDVCHFYSVSYWPVPPPPPPPPTPIPGIVWPTPTPYPVYNEPLRCSAYVPWEVAPGAAFQQHISITNPYGSQTKTGVMFYVRINPSGYLPIYSCTPNCSVTTGLMTVSLGTIYPGQTRVVTIDGYGPHWQGMSFNLQYSTRSVGVPEYTCDQAGFMVSGTNIMQGGDVPNVQPPTP